MTPETRYARTTDRTHVAYQAFGEGPFDILVLRSWHSNIEHERAEPVLAGIYRRLAALGRVILLDRRGTGLSDPIDPDALPTLEDRIDDIRARTNDAAFVEWIRNNERMTGSAENAVAQARLLVETNVDDVLPAIHVPTLVAWRRDSSGAESARHVAGRIPHAMTHELPGIDHMFISGDWRAALRVVEDFIESLVGTETDDDRILATVMFTDIVGSTRLTRELGDRARRDLVERHHAVIRPALSRHRGREIDTAGDGFFAAFDGPARAIRCADAIREGVATLGLEIRIGLHAGECERVGPALRGMAVHVGARVSSLATAGEILVTSTVRDLDAGSGIRFADLGERQLKGVPDAWRIFRVEDVGNPDRIVGDSV